MASRRAFTGFFANGARYCGAKPRMSASTSKWGKTMQNLLKNQSTRQWSSNNRVLAALASERMSSNLAIRNFEPSVAVSNAFRSPPLIVAAGGAEIDCLDASADLDECDTFSNEEEALSGTIMSIFNMTRYRHETWKSLESVRKQ